MRYLFWMTALILVVALLLALVGGLLLIAGRIAGTKKQSVAASGCACALILVIVAACAGLFGGRDETPRRVRPVGIGDVTTVSDRDKFGLPREGFHWIFSDDERMDQCRSDRDYYRAEKEGVAKRLSFGTRIRLKADRGLLPGSYRWEYFQIEVLDGPLSGHIGWVKPETIDWYITE